MAVPHKPRHSSARRGDDGGQAQTKTLGVLVAVMVVAGVVALIMTLVGGNSSKDAAAGQPSGSQVGNQTSTDPSATATTSVVPATSAVPTTSAASTTAPTVAPTSAAAPATPATPAATSKPADSASTATKVVKYTVKSGDNLTLIAKWFNQRGFGSVYDWNKSVIGQNPDLIYAGQTIIVSLKGDRMNVSTGSK